MESVSRPGVERVDERTELRSAIPQPFRQTDHADLPNLRSILSENFLQRGFDFFPPVSATDDASQFFQKHGPGFGLDEASIPHQFGHERSRARIR